jgi:hypothetical protein
MKMPDLKIIVLLIIWFCMQIVGATCQDGTLLYKEDFGGNSQSDPIFSTTPIPQITGIDFHSNGDPRYGYAIRKWGWQHTSWYRNMDDHTFPNDTSRGYFLQIDGTEKSAQFYTCTISNLCVGSTLYFSMWGMSSVAKAYATQYADAKLKLIYCCPVKLFYNKNLC